MNVLKEQVEQTTEVSSDVKSLEVIAESESLWKIKLVFPFPDASEREMVGHLRGVKVMLAERYKVPAELLEFRELLEKSRTRAGLEAILIIGMASAGKGAPLVRLHPMETSRGELIPDMVAEVDFYYMDEFDHTITYNRVEIELKKQGVDLKLVDKEALQAAVSRVLKRKSFVKKMEVAWGKLPSVGVDAELEYTFFTDPGSAEDFDEYRMGRKVKAKDVVCQKIPAHSGRNEGYDVRGNPIPPIRGLDFDLAEGEGTRLSLDNLNLIALRDGVPIMNRTTRKVYTLAGEKIVPDKISVSVKPLVELVAEDIINIALEESVEVRGDLREGSRIESEGEVFLAGDVEKNTSVKAKDNVLIDGEVQGGEVTSDKSVFASKNVQNAEITANDDVKVQGAVTDSTLSGRKVQAADVKGSNIVAGQKVTIGKVGNGVAGKRTTVRLGREEFYKEKLESGKEAVKGLTASLERVKKLFGGEILSKLTGANQHQLLVQFIKELHQRGYPELDERAIDSLRQLLESINPLKGVIAEKNEQLEVLQQKATDENASKPVIVIKEKITDTVEVKMKGKTTTIEPTRGAAAIAPAKDGSIKTYDLPKPSRKPDLPDAVTKSIEKKKKK